MIPVSTFLKKMNEQWLEFGNIPNQALQKAWKQQCEVFNEMIQLSKPPTKFEEFFSQEDIKRETVWKILQPPTGSGKTLGTVVYAAMLAMPGLNHHPGCLIVTRLKDDADDTANRINELSVNYHCKLVRYFHEN